MANPPRYKNNTAIFKQAELKDRFKVSAGGATLELARALEEDWGNYSCALEPAGAAAAPAPAPAMGWRLHARVYTRLPSINTNVVEGQKLRLICKVFVVVAVSRGPWSGRQVTVAVPGSPL